MCYWIHHVLNCFNEYTHKTFPSSQNFNKTQGMLFIVFVAQSFKTLGLTTIDEKGLKLNN